MKVITPGGSSPRASAVGLPRGSWTPQALARLGCALGSLRAGEAVALGHDGSRGAEALAGALISGVRCSGARAMDFGAGWRALFRFGVTYTSAKLAAFLEADGERLTLMGEGGFPLEAEALSAVAGLWRRRSFARIRAERVGARADLCGMRALYAAELIRRAPISLAGTAARVRSANGALQALLADTLGALGCETADGPLFLVSPDGEGLELELGGRRLTHEQTVCLAARMEFLSGRDAAVPGPVPAGLERLARRHSRRALCCDGTDADVRALAAAQPFFRDGAILAIRLLSAAGPAVAPLAELCALMEDEIRPELALVRPKAERASAERKCTPGKEGLDNRAEEL